MADLSVEHLRCEYRINPMGVDDPAPRLSWKLRTKSQKNPDRGLAQSAYQILVATTTKAIKAGTADLWDSGKITSNRSVFLQYGGKPLQSGQRAWWTVRVWDQDGNALPVPAPVFWEAGLLAAKDWSAKWIGSQLLGGTHVEAPVPMFRKTFTLPAGKSINSARLYVTAMGLYEFRLNGQKVGDEELAPFWTDYRKRIQYQVHDVTSMVHAGMDNAAGALLGDGWYCGYTGLINRRQLYGDRPKLLAQLIIQFTDGSSQTIATDGSWTTSPSQILSADLFMGESYDARLEQWGWDTGSFTENPAWTPATAYDFPDAHLVAMTGPSVRAIKEIHPIKVTRWHHKWIVDLGQNMVGRVRMKVKGSAGTTVMLQFVEMLEANGGPYTTNLRAARQQDRYTLRGDAGGEIFEPRFTFHGFRYVAIDNYPGDLTADYITGIVMHSDMEETGTFECSDALVNQLQKNIQWGQRGNFVDIPTDCPQRDERLGWTGDAQAFVRTAAFNFDVSGFFAKWSQDLRDAQGSLGSYPSFVPNNDTVRIVDGVEHGADGGPAWADAGIICPWTAYQCFGDRRLIEKHYDSMCKFVDHLHEIASRFDGIRCHPDWNGAMGYGDWLSQDGKDGLFGSTARDLIGTAFLANDAKLLAGIAADLGKKSDSVKYMKIFDRSVAAFRRRFVTADGLIIGNNQTAYVLALHFNLLPTDQRPAATAALVRNIRANGNRLNTGFVGTPYLNHVLTKAGRLDVAYELLMQKNWPSWLYAVTKGATTIWERWDGWTDEKGFQDPGMNSFNHYAYGAVGDWLYGVVAGVEIDAKRPGYEHILLKPHPLVGGPLTHAKATLETTRGRVESGWKLKGHTLVYDVLIPPNATATVWIPAIDVAKVTESRQPLKTAEGVRQGAAAAGYAVVELSSGRYAFSSTIA